MSNNLDRIKELEEALRESALNHHQTVHHTTFAETCNRSICVMVREVLASER